MQLMLKTKLAVGLAKSDLNSQLSHFGTGSNLVVEALLEVDSSSIEVIKEKWQKILKDLHSDLDHVHLNIDHPQLNSKNWGESELLDWLVTKLKVYAELKALSLRTYENYSVTWESKGS